jgi:hypothetical protein
MPINWGKYPHDYIGAIDMLRFYRVLLIIYSCIFLVLWIDVGVKIDPLKAFFWAIAFGLSTYLIIILGVGHNAKALLRTCHWLLLVLFWYFKKIHSGRISYALRLH